MERSHSNLCCLSGYKSREAALGRPRLYFLQLLFVCVRAHMRVFVKEVESASLFFCDLERCVCALSASPHPSHTSDLPCLCPVFIASSEVSLWSRPSLDGGMGRGVEGERETETERSGEEGLKCSHCFYIMVLALARSISCPGRPDITHTHTLALTTFADQQSILDAVSLATTSLRFYSWLWWWGRMMEVVVLKRMSCDTPAKCLDVWLPTCECEPFIKIYQIPSSERWVLKLKATEYKSLCRERIVLSAFVSSNRVVFTAAC